MNKTDEENLERMFASLERAKKEPDDERTHDQLDIAFLPFRLDVDGIGLPDLLGGETCNAILRAHREHCSGDVRIWAEVETEGNYITLDKMGKNGAQYYGADYHWHDVDLNERQKDLVNWACEAMFEGAN